MGLDLFPAQPIWWNLMLKKEVSRCGGCAAGQPPATNILGASGISRAGNVTVTDVIPVTIGGAF